MKHNGMLKMTVAALLCAMGIVIPMFSPFKIVIEPASFTLGSHVAIIIAMFIAPSVAVSVALGTALGFFLGGFPIVVVLRAATHVVFALMGAILLQKQPDILHSARKSGVFSLGLAVVHALCEVMVVSLFYFGNGMSQAYYTRGFASSVLWLVGVGTVVHSMMDYSLAAIIWKSADLRYHFSH